MTEPWFDELSEFLRIPSISADPAHAAMSSRGGVGAATSSAPPAASASWSTGTASRSRSARCARRAPATRRRCSATAISTCSRPIRSSSGTPRRSSRRSAASYLYGRGTVDDKGQLYLLLAAARELSLAGELPVNVRFCCDGEEESGGHSIVEFIEADERGADAAVIFDSGMIRRDVPAFNVATRGIAYFHVTVRTGDHDLHSGMFGGAALNAAHV